MLIRLGCVAAFAIACAVSTRLVAGEAQKWDDLPKAVQDSILANGGKVGNEADKESGQVDGKTLYEVPVKDKDGNILDLQITADGRLIEVKTDDAPEAVQQRIERA